MSNIVKIIPGQEELFRDLYYNFQFALDFTKEVINRTGLFIPKKRTRMGRKIVYRMSDYIYIYLEKINENVYMGILEDRLSRDGYDKILRIFSEQCTRKPNTVPELELLNFIFKEIREFETKNRVYEEYKVSKNESKYLFINAEEKKLLKQKRDLDTLTLENIYISLNGEISSFVPMDNSKKLDIDWNLRYDRTAVLAGNTLTSMYLSLIIKNTEDNVNNLLEIYKRRISSEYSRVRSIVSSGREINPQDEWLHKRDLQSYKILEHYKILISLANILIILSSNYKRNLYGNLIDNKDFEQIFTLYETHFYEQSHFNEAEATETIKKMFRNSKMILGSHSLKNFKLDPRIDFYEEINFIKESSNWINKLYRVRTSHIYGEELQFNNYDYNLINNLDHLKLVRDSIYTIIEGHRNYIPASIKRMEEQMLFIPEQLTGYKRTKTILEQFFNMNKLEERIEELEGTNP